jgi:integrase
MTPRVTQWEDSVGFLPWKVSVYEEPSRNGTLYLRWRQDGNWKKKSLQRPLRTKRGAIDETTKDWAKAQAAAQYARLVAGVPDEDRAPRAPLTIRQGLDAVLDPTTGKYPTDTAHRREVKRELERVIVEWGVDTAWVAIKRADVRKLWRRRILQLRADGADGLRGAEITVQRMNAVASWLRDEELIPAGACVGSRRWKQELAADWLELSGARALPDPKRPRHTLDEMRRILATAVAVDPRFELAMVLGAELRLGQVIRCRRPDLNLDHATLTVRGKGQKKGTVSHLTDGQMRVARHALTDGYLRLLEGASADYPLFPAGPLPGGRTMKDPKATVARHATAAAIGRDVVDGWFHEAERLAGVPVVKGRAAYGLRRAAVDAAKEAGISREGLQAHGGWKDTQMPDRIYADQQMDYARDEAKAVRAKIRGEAE